MEKISIMELSKIWLKYKEKKIKKTSLLQYQRIIEKYIDVYLGFYYVSEITVLNIMDFIDRIDKGISSKTLQDILVVLKSVLYYGNVIGYKCIPLKAIPSVKVLKHNVVTIEEKELCCLENYIIQHLNYRNIGIMICLYTGLRLGEICALQWADIDLIEQRILINKSIQRISENGKSYTEIGIPKTQNSIREIPINNVLYHILKDVRNPKGYVITGTEHYLDPRTYQYYFKKILREIKIKEYHFHVLRHTFATRCVQSDVDIKSLSEILGHSSVNTTLNIYVHSSFSIKKTQLNKLKSPQI